MQSSQPVDARIIRAFLALIGEYECDATLTESQRGSLRVARQCLDNGLSSVLNVNPTVDSQRDLIDMRALFYDKESNRATAERLKEFGNEEMRNENTQEAINYYTDAIKIYPYEAAYYCNRSAAYAKLLMMDECIRDASQAISLKPDYSKAHGRLGMAFMTKGELDKARSALEAAVRFDPNNKNAQENLEILNKAQPQRQGPFSNIAEQSGVDIGSLLRNPALAEMASQFVQNPTVQGLMANMLGSLTGSTTQTNANSDPNQPQQGLGDLFEAGQRLASQLSQTNPGILEVIRNLASGSNTTQTPGTQDDTKDKEEKK
ncbi:hypothetical protein ACOME3_004811 [Neoechinorhynchus agilis]